MVMVTSQGKFLANFSVFEKGVFHLSPKWTIYREQLHISQDIETISRSRKSDTNAVVDLKKSYRISFVVSNQRQNNDVVFFTLNNIKKLNLTSLTIQTLKK